MDVTEVDTIGKRIIGYKEPNHELAVWGYDFHDEKLRKSILAILPDITFHFTPVHAQKISNN